MKASLDYGEGYAVGDVVTATDVATGDEVTIAVGTVIAVATDDSLVVEYRAGESGDASEEPG